MQQLKHPKFAISLREERFVRSYESIVLKLILGCFINKFNLDF